MRGRRDDLTLPQHVGTARVLEQPEVELQRQDTADGAVQVRLGQQPAVDRVESTLVELRRRHDHVVAGLHRGGCGVRVVGLHLLLPHHPADVVPVGDERPGVAPLAAQHVAQQPVVDRDRDAVHRLVAEHERPATFSCHAFEGRQEPRPELSSGDVGFAGVAPALGLGVPREVLGGRQDRGRVVQTVTLVAAHHRRRELAQQVRVLAERLVDPAPAQVPRYAENRREGPVHPGSRDLDSGGPSDALDEVGVPARRHAELGREDRGALEERVPVDAVLTHQQRDAQPGARRQLVRLGEALRRDVQDRSDVRGQHVVRESLARVELHHLPDLLLHRHSLEEVGNALGDRSLGVAVGQLVAHVDTFVVGRTAGRTNPDGLVRSRIGGRSAPGVRVPIARRR